MILSTNLANGFLTQTNLKIFFILLALSPSGMFIKYVVLVKYSEYAWRVLEKKRFLYHDKKYLQPIITNLVFFKFGFFSLLKYTSPAGHQDVSGCSTTGGSQGMHITFASVKRMRQNPLWLDALKRRRQNVKQAYQWPQNRTCVHMCQPKTLTKDINVPSGSFIHICSLNYVKFF